MSQREKSGGTIGEADARLKAIARENADKIGGSGMFLLLFNESMVEEVIPLIQMGLAIYMNKPVLLLVPEGAAIPENLLMVAKKIEYYKRDTSDMSSFGAASDRLIKWAVAQDFMKDQGKS